MTLCDSVCDHSVCFHASSAVLGYRSSQCYANGVRGCGVRACVCVRARVCVCIIDD